MSKNKKFRQQEINLEQIEKFLRGAYKKLGSAKKILAIDNELSYQTAYDSMIKASLAFILTFGKRPRALPGHHIEIIKFIENKLGKNYQGLIGLFDEMRKKRNRAIYEADGFIGEYETKEAIKTAVKFIRIIENEISKIHPQKKLINT